MEVDTAATPAARPPSRAIAAERSSPVVHLVASSGGHLELLTAIHAAVGDFERIWLTPASERARSIAATGDRTEEIPFYGRNPIRLTGHLRRVIALLVKERPKLVVTSGAGTAVPFCVLARLFGANIVFIETMARITNASISGRVLSRLASQTIVQWPGMMDVYRRARLCEPALLEDVVLRHPHHGEGTFVAVGTHVQPFDRLLRMADEAVAAGVLPKPAIAQIGETKYQPRAMSAESFMAPSAMQEAMRRARYIVCHAGSGIISAALGVGRRPLVLPRLKAKGEHVDDHQLQIVEKLAELGLVRPISDAIREDDLAAVDEPLVAPERTADAPPSIEDALRDALEGVLGLPLQPLRAA